MHRWVALSWLFFGWRAVSASVGLLCGGCCLVAPALETVYHNKLRFSRYHRNFVAAFCSRLTKLVQGVRVWVVAHVRGYVSVCAHVRVRVYCRVRLVFTTFSHHVGCRPRPPGLFSRQLPPPRRLYVCAWRRINNSQQEGGLGVTCSTQSRSRFSDWVWGGGCGPVWWVLGGARWWVQRSDSTFCSLRFGLDRIGAKPRLLDRIRSDSAGVRYAAE